MLEVIVAIALVLLFAIVGALVFLLVKFNNYVVKLGKKDNIDSSSIPVFTPESPLKETELERVHRIQREANEQAKKDRKEAKVMSPRDKILHRVNQIDEMYSKDNYYTRR